MANSPPPPKAGRTLDDFLAELEAQNKTVSSWAREQGLHLPAVYAVLRGRSLGRYGAGRQVLITMGVTPPSMFGDAVAPQRANFRRRAATAG